MRSTSDCQSESHQALQVGPTHDQSLKPHHRDWARTHEKAKNYVPGADDEHRRGIIDNLALSTQPFFVDQPNLQNLKYIEIYFVRAEQK